METIQMQCPASMCPLLAKNGSEWTKEKGAPCPGKGGLTEGCCPWWDMGCGGNGMVHAVDEAEMAHGKVLVISQNKPKREGFGQPKSYDCPNAGFCRWQEQSPTGLCAPREAMKRGLDPRVCLF